MQEISGVGPCKELIWVRRPFPKQRLVLTPAPLPSSATAVPLHRYRQSKIPSSAASIQPAELAGILTEACAGNKEHVRLLILKRQRESSAGEYLRFRIYYISCTVTPAFYSPYGLGEMLRVCVS